jgi:nitroimidazol reductase NimA-like FMN-containing flavoprotein (pyridoxamine 5'-phosphate oxidase superfamily)
MTAINVPIRKNRDVTDEEEWIHGFLEKSQTCVVGTSDGGHVFLNPTLFLYERGTHKLYFHTAGRGRTRDNIQRDGTVTVCIYDIGRLVPGEKAIDFTVEYASVVIFGRATIITEAVEVRRVLQTQMDKYASGFDYVPFTDEDAARATVYRVDIEHWSAKRNPGKEETHVVS